MQWPIRWWVYWLAAVLALGFLGFAWLGCARYDVTCGIEAINYATQTITTVGYGNWSVGEGDDAARRALAIKLFSSVYSLIGALMFGLFIAVLQDKLSE